MVNNHEQANDDETTERLGKLTRVRPPFGLGQLYAKNDFYP